MKAIDFDISNYATGAQRSEADNIFLELISFVTQIRAAVRSGGKW